jgi:hypothetical protein
VLPADPARCLQPLPAPLRSAGRLRHPQRGTDLRFGLPGARHPRAIRSDNGPPFASTGAGGLTALSVWWQRLGIRHDRITPGKPQQNGRQERFHRTLAELVQHPEHDVRAQQRAFDRFRYEYNKDVPACTRRCRDTATIASLTTGDAARPQATAGTGGRSRTPLRTGVADDRGDDEAADPGAVCDGQIADAIGAPRGESTISPRAHMGASALGQWSAPSREPHSFRSLAR